MAFTLISSAAIGSTDINDAETGSITTTGANLLIGGSASYEPAAVTFIDSKVNTWTELTEQSVSGNPKARLRYVYSGIVGTGHTFDASTVGGYPSTLAAAFSGAKASPFDQQNGSAGAGATRATGSITPTEDNELVIALIATDGTVVSIDSGFTLLHNIAYDGVHFCGALAYKILGAGTASVALNPTFTLSGSADAAAVIASFKAAAAVVFKSAWARGSNKILVPGRAQ